MFGSKRRAIMFGMRWQDYAWGSSSSSAIRAKSLDFTTLGEIFAYKTLGGRVGWFFVCLGFFYPTIKVATFHLPGWCVLGVFLLGAFTCLGNECQDLLSPCDGIHGHTDWTSVYTLIQKSFFREWNQKPCQLQGENIPSTRRPRGGLNPWHGITQDGKPNTLPTELFWPLMPRMKEPVVLFEMRLLWMR